MGRPLVIVNMTEWQTQRTVNSGNLSVVCTNLSLVCTKWSMIFSRLNTDVAFLQETHLRGRDQIRLGCPWVGGLSFTQLSIVEGWQFW